MSKEIYAALAAAQIGFAAIQKSRTGFDGDHQFQYADLNDLINATRPALADNGLCVMQLIQSEGGATQVVTILAHSSGESIKSVIDISAQFQTIKQLGAAVSYMRRYAYQSILCLAADEDLDNGGGDVRAESNKSQAVDRYADEANDLDDKRQWYPDALFDKAYVNRKKSIKDGSSTAEEIIAMVESRYRMTEEQKQYLLSIKKDEE